jgi:XTP/dITP diphosphohydrolase
MREIVLASHNAGKIREIEAALAALNLRVTPQSHFAVPQAEEPHATFIENALQKARHACLHTGLPALGEDSGICVEALGGAPGVHSARFAGEPRSDVRNNERLLQALVHTTTRRAHYCCVMVLLRHPGDPQPIVAEGEWHGEILSAPRGTGGFGYDPLFFDPVLGKTGAELSVVEKNRASHRGKALAALIARLRAEPPE